MNQYKELKEKHQKDVDAFPIAFAFTQEQFNNSMRELGLDPSDTDKVIGIGGGGFIRRSDVVAFKAMFAKHRTERAAAIAADAVGTGYIYQAFLYELGNQEYCYTGDLTDTLAALELDLDDVNNDPRLRMGLNRALKTYREKEAM